MAVLCQAITVVIPVDVIEWKYPRGLHGYLMEDGGLRYSDGVLTGASFMSPADVQRHVEGLVAQNLDPAFGLKVWGRASDRRIGPDTIYLFGNEYEVLTAVEAARAVTDHLDYEIPDSMVRPPPWKATTDT